MLQCRRRLRTLWRHDISPKALGPASGRSAVLGRNALIRPGDCDQARHRSNGAECGESQAPLARPAPGTNQGAEASSINEQSAGTTKAEKIKTHSMFPAAQPC